jgi:hypothetical protein
MTRTSERTTVTSEAVPDVPVGHSWPLFLFVSAEVEGIALEGDFLPEIPAGDLDRSQPQPGVMAGVVHHGGAFVLAGVKSLGLCQPGVGCPCPRYIADDLGHAAQFSPAQFAVRLTRSCLSPAWLLAGGPRQTVMAGICARMRSSSASSEMPWKS